MSTMTIAKGDAAMLTLDEIKAIPDPQERVTKAAEFVRKFEERAESARGMRDMATCVAHLDDGVPPVTMYRDVLKCSRGLFVRIIQRAPASRPRIDDAVEVARESAAAVKRHSKVVKEGQAIVQATSLLLMNGGRDPVTRKKVTPISNADVSRLTGLTTARIAQVRTGTR